MFLYRCLKSLQLTSLAKGVKPGLNRDDVYRIQFAFPPLSEQKRIAAILDQADALRPNRREALDLLSGLSTVIFESMFGDLIENTKQWPSVLVRDFVDGFQSGKNIVAADKMIQIRGSMS